MSKFRKTFKSIVNGTFEYPDSVYEFYENSTFWNAVKHPLCSPESLFANFAYLLYGDLDCTCCAFFRGILFGSLLTFGVGFLI